MEYRKELDGLRAVAVLPVILFHAGSSWFGGGFVGVDIFFVISGYLITSIILAEKQAGIFSLVGFYERRARRILPALFFLMLACLPFAWFWMLPYQLKEFCQSLVAMAAFASNFLFWKQSSYFDASADLKPLLHTWSLAVEEQYYVLFPIALALVWRFRRGRLAAIFISLAFLSLALAHWVIKTDASAGFYLLHTRGWELLVGAVIALYATTKTQAEQELAIRQWLSALGFILIAYAVCYFDRNTPFPSICALVPTMGAALVIRYADAQTIVGRMLSRRLPVGIGLISYSVYLWHQPVLAFFRIKTGQLEPSPWMLIPYLLLVTALACFSFMMVERPFRSRKTISRSQIFSLAAIGMSFFGVLGFIGHSSGGFLAAKLRLVPVEKRDLLVQVDTELAARAQVVSANHDYLSQPAFETSTRNRKVVIVGDSMAIDLGTALADSRSVFPGYEFRLLSIRTECLDSLGQSAVSAAGIAPTSATHDNCSRSLQTTLSSRLLLESDLVVITGLWKKDSNFESIETFLNRISAVNRKILVLGTAGFLDIPSISYKIAMDSKTYSQDDLDSLVAVSRRRKFDEGNDLMSSLVGKLGLGYRNRHQLYCDATQTRCRILFLEGGSVLLDNTHLTQQGMRITAQRVAELGWLSK